MRSKPTILTLAALLTCACISAYAQIEKTLRFIPELADFGMIRESDGPVSMTIKAINISDKPTFIISARTSCGCSEAEYDAREIAPGDSTTVTIKYDPTNRPGKFQKSAKIFTGKERVPNSLKIKGNVIPSKDNLDRAYPEKAGSLRLSARFANAGEIRNTESRPIFIGIYNDSDTPVALTADTDSKALEARILPDTVEPFGIATMSLMLKGKQIPPSTGDFTFHAGIITTESGDSIVAIPVSGALKKTE